MRRASHTVKKGIATTGRCWHEADLDNRIEHDVGPAVALKTAPCCFFMPSVQESRAVRRGFKDRSAAAERRDS
jgi:hypothetical protein